MMEIICFSGHMLLNLSRDKQDFLKEVVESFANRSGQSALYDALFSRQLPKDSCFLGNDDAYILFVFYCMCVCKLF